MNTYYCKCGMAQQCSASGATTALKEPERMYPNQLRAYGETPDLTCKGCPYICQRETWKGQERVVTHEARMSKQPPVLYTGVGKYTLTDNTVGKIYTLDMDFARQIKAAEKEIDGLMPDRYWDNPLYQLAQYREDGRFVLTISPEGGKRGIDAKRELFEMFFAQDGSRKDMTPEEEKDKVLRTIVEARKQAQGKGTTMSYKSEDIYRSLTGVRWRIHWDEETKAYCTQQSADGATWTPCNSSFYPHFPEAHATFEAIVRNLRLVPEVELEEKQCAEEEPPEEDSASGIAAEAGELSPADAPAAALTRPDAEAVSLAPEFDYTGLPEQTVAVLQSAERMVRNGYKMARAAYCHIANAVGMVHDELVHSVDKRGNQYSEQTFTKWCTSVGISRSYAYQLLQTSNLILEATPKEQKVLESLPESLVKSISKKSAPPELVERVKAGDITTNKEYQDLLRQMREKDAELERVREEAAMDRKEQEDANAAAKRFKAEADRRAQDQQRVEGLLKTREDQIEQLNRELSASRDVVRGLKERHERMQGVAEDRDMWKARAEELENRPVEVAVDETAAEKRAQELAAEMRKGDQHTIEQLREALRAQADQSNPDVIRFKAQFERVQHELDQLRNLLADIRGQDPATADKLTRAMAALVQKYGGEA